MINQTVSRLLAELLFQVGGKFRDVFFLDTQRRNDLLAATECFFVTAKILRHADDGLAAKLIGLLDNRAINRTRRDSGENFLFLVEADD